MVAGTVELADFRSGLWCRNICGTAVSAVAWLFAARWVDISLAESVCGSLGMLLQCRKGTRHDFSPEKKDSVREQSSCRTVWELPTFSMSMRYEKTAIRRALFYRCRDATWYDRGHMNWYKIATKDKYAPNFGLPHDWHRTPLLAQGQVLYFL